MLFLTLAVTQLGVALGSRARPGTRENPSLLLAVAGALVLQLAAIYAPGLSDLLGTVPLPAADLAVAAAGLPIGYLAMRVERYLEHRHQHGGPAASDAERVTLPG
jgi:Ca2+-transporting ATPase